MVDAQDLRILGGNPRTIIALEDTHFKLASDK
ncbi:MAG: hypothetical protein RLZZ165_620 [Bacteroidota bacterium]